MTTLFGSRTATMEMRPARTRQSGNTYDDRVRKTLRELSARQLEAAPRTAAICFDPWRHTTFAGRAVVAARAAALRRDHSVPIWPDSNLSLDGTKISGLRHLLSCLGIL